MTPINETAERAVLSVMMAYETCATRGVTELEPVDFYKVKNRELFLTMRRLIKEGQLVNMPTLASVSEDFDYVVDVGTEFALPSQFESYVDTLRNARQRRELITACNKITTAAQDNEEDFLSQAQKAITDVMAIGNASTQPADMDAVSAVVDLSESQMGTRTGFGDLDVMLNGLHAGDLIVIGARPSMGKTAFSMNISLNIARRGSVVSIFSLEMSKEQLLQRAAISLSGCSRRDAMRKDVAQVKKLVDAGMELSKMQLYVDDRCGLTAEQIRSTCFRIQQRAGGLDLVVVDYLQLMRATSKKNGNREQEVAELSRGMKLMARQLNCPVILVAQLNRGLESRTDKTPRMSDLRESGAIEQDADVVVFLHRPSVYGESTDEGAALAVVAKNRNGSTGDVELRWTGELFRFTSACWTSDIIESAV